MNKRTPLYHQHEKLNAKIIDFGGWDMPVHYGSQLQEHKIVREDAGMFDVSHMTVLDIKGGDAKVFLQKVLANNVAKLTTPGKALYSCMLNEEGGVVDDLIAYYFSSEDYRLVVNASTREKDIAWLNKQAKSYSVTITERTDTAMIAIQGPKAREKTHVVLSQPLKEKVETLKPFQAAVWNDWLVARTGYTGEDGYEIILPAKEVEAFWNALLQAGVAACGLGARDTLRLEAGLNLYGSDMNEITSPLESNLAWTIAWEPVERDFIGRSALVAQQKVGLSKKLVGLVLEERGMLRDHLPVIIPGVGKGEITSGSFSPTLGKAIALARIPICDATECSVEIRGKLFAARIVKPAFVRHGKAVEI